MLGKKCLRLFSLVKEVRLKFEVYFSLKISEERSGCGSFRLSLPSV